jgi:hypothetical protein
MKRAAEADVVSTKCSDQGLIVAQFEPKSEPVFYYDPPTNVSFGAGPVGLIDPYEKKWVTVEDSSVPNSGQGPML